MIFVPSIAISAAVKGSHAMDDYVVDVSVLSEWLRHLSTLPQGDRLVELYSLDKREVTCDLMKRCNGIYSYDLLNYGE